MKFNIRHGELLDVIGTAVRFDNVTFVPAITKLQGNSFSLQFDLLDWCRETSSDVPLIVHGESNAPWVLGRLIHIFNTDNTPEDERGEKCCLNTSFAAVLHDFENTTIPFDVSDSYGRTFLWFSSEDEPPMNLRTAIANAFYRLLLDGPESLANYENRMFHSGACVWIEFGVSCGEPYMQEAIDDPD